MVFNIEIINSHKYVAIISENDNYKKNFIESLRLDNNILINKEKSCSGKKIFKNFSKLTSVFEYFNLSKINFHDLEKEDNIYLTIIEALLYKPNILYLNDVLTWLRDWQKDKIYAYAKEKDIFIVNMTTCIEEVLLSDYLIVMEEDRIILEGDIITVLKEEKVIKKLGFNLPFYVDLSLQLNYYEVLDGIYLNMDELESAIWK